jgi:hypothetical protein
MMQQNVTVQEQYGPQEPSWARGLAIHRGQFHQHRRVGKDDHKSARNFCLVLSERLYCKVNECLTLDEDVVVKLGKLC